MTQETTKRPWKKYVRRVLIGLGIAVGLWLLSSVAVAYCLTRRIGGPSQEPMPDFGNHKVESYRIATADGEELGAWFIDGKANEPAVLLLHGYLDSRQSMTGHAKFLSREGCPVLMISLRAHGDSSGTFNDVGYSAKQDVIAGVEWLRKKYPDRPIVVYGRSMGAAAAMFAAKELGDRVAGYIWKVPYRDLYTTLHNRMEHYLPPVLSTIGYTGFWLTAPVILPNAEDIAPIKYIGDIPQSVPILILSAKKDRKSKPKEIRDIFRRVESHATRVVFERANHTNIRTSNREKFEKVVGEFLDKISKKK